MRDLPKKHVFEKGNANWIDEMNEVTTKYINTRHSLTNNTSVFKKMRIMFTQIYYTEERK